MIDSTIVFLQKYKWLRRILLFIVTLIIIAALWFILAILGMGYEDGVSTEGISKWSYTILEYTVGFPFNFYQKHNVEYPFIMTLLTTSIVIHLFIYVIKQVKKFIK